MIGALARWFHYTLPEIDAMTLSDYWMLNRFLTKHPPVDLLVAGYLGYQEPGKPTKRAAARGNAAALAEMPKHVRAAKLPAMPAHLQTPDMLKLMQEVKAEWQTS